MKPSYGLTDDEVASMLKEGFAHATEDRDARALAEQRVEAEAILASVKAALDKDPDLLDAGERESLEAAMAEVRSDAAGADHRRIKEAIASLNRASETFAARRMDRAISGALSGRRIDEVRG